jgi:atypical dual specificity phosphatase
VITKVRANLYLSGARDSERLAISNPLEIAGVVNVNTSPNYAKAKGVEYFHCPFDELGSVVPEQFERVIAAIRQNLLRGNVLVHCQAGSSRSPVVIAAYLHVSGHRDFDVALSELKERRPVVAPTKLMIESAKAYLAQAK